MMEKNIFDLLVVFDDVLPQTPDDEANARFTFISHRSKDFAIYLHISPADMYSNICVKVEGKFIRLVEFMYCKRIRVLDQKKKCIEIVGGSIDSFDIRCFLQLTNEDSWIEIDTQYQYCED